MKAFIVFGQTGEYSDHRNWPVRGFTSRERAEAFEFELTKTLKKYDDEYHVRCDDAEDTLDLYAWMEQSKAEITKIDPGFESAYPAFNADYYTVEVEIES